MPPEECLRSLTAEALLRAQPDRELLPDSLGLMATANAFVMLGLVAEVRADEILAVHRAALEAKGVAPGRGVNAGELTIRPGAHEYWTARGDSVAALADLPLRVLPAAARLPVTVSGQQAEICFEWLTLTRSGWRMTYRAAGTWATAEPGAAEGDRRPPRGAVEQVLTQVAIIDDTGHRYQLTPGRAGGWLRAGQDGWELHGDASADPSLLAEPGWLEFGNTAWPMIMPCFTVRAADDQGDSYRGMPGSWQGGTSHQGSGEFWFWPPVPEACERLTITVSTLWEAAWADVDLPGRTE